MKTSRVCHYPDKINNKGEVSALCFKRPHAIDLSKATWTANPAGVTCSKCKAAMREKGGQP